MCIIARHFIVGVWQVMRVSTSDDKRTDFMKDMQTLFPQYSTLLVFDKEEKLANGDKKYKASLTHENKEVSKFLMTHKPYQNNHVTVELVCIFIVFFIF